VCQNFTFLTQRGFNEGYLITRISKGTIKDKGSYPSNNWNAEGCNQYLDEQVKDNRSFTKNDFNKIKIRIERLSLNNKITLFLLLHLSPLRNHILFQEVFLFL
jgi:hypothetical protein